MGNIKDRKILWQGNFLRCVSVTYIDSSDKTRKWEMFERVNCDGIVGIVPVTDKNEAVLIRQFRPAVNRHVIEFPAGLSDRGESLDEAARRELLEETGYSAKELILLAEGPLSSGASGEILTAYLAKGLEFVGMGQRDDTEDIEVLKIPITDLRHRLSSLGAEGNYIDLKILGLIELAKKYL